MESGAVGRLNGTCRTSAPNWDPGEYNIESTIELTLTREIKVVNEHATRMDLLWTCHLHASSDISGYPFTKSDYLREEAS